MPLLNNPRYESFAQFLAQGKTADDAYALAGFKPNRGNATRLKANESIIARVTELQKGSAKRHDVTIDRLTLELELSRLKALKRGQISAAVAATMGKAKLHGLVVDKTKHSGAIGNYDLSKLSEKEIDQLDKLLTKVTAAFGNPAGEAEA